MTMSTINGRLSTCERCGAQVFSKCVGEGETDGGYTRWNKFEPYPEGWASVEIFPLTKPGEGHRYLLLCPECTGEHAGLMEKFMEGHEGGRNT